MKIAQKITLSFLLFSLTPVIIIGFLLFLSLRFYLRDQVQNQLIVFADLKEQQLYQLANTKLEELATFTNNLRLQLLLEEYQQTNNPQTLNLLTSILETEVQKNPNLNAVYLLSPDGMLLATTSPWATQADWSAESYFEEAKTKVTSTFIKSEEQLSPQLLLSGPITIQGKLQGVVILDTDSSELLLLTQAASELGTTAESFLLNSFGPITPLKVNTSIHPQSLTAQADTLVSERTRAVYPSIVDYKGDQVFAVTRFIDIFNLSLVTKIDQTEAYQPIFAVLTILLTSSLIVIILATLAAFYLGQSISAPLLNLASAAAQVKAGNFATRVFYEGQDELGILAETFNSMMDSIQKADQAKNEFLSLASHQLRTPLASINWAVELLLSKAKKLTSSQIKSLKDIQSSAKHMTTLTHALLNTSRIEGGSIKLNPKSVDLRLLIEAVITELKPRFDAKKIKLNTHLPNFPKLNLDIELTTEVYRNLLVNAIKYTPPEGSITLNVSKQDNNILTEISDTGVGIPQEDHRRVFTKFYRGKNAISMDPEGSGLGLFLSKTIINSAGGRIWFESKHGKGTTFWFTLPLVENS